MLPAQTIGRAQSVPPIGMASMRLMTLASLMRGERFTRVMPGSRPKPELRPLSGSGANCSRIFVSTMGGVLFMFLLSGDVMMKGNV